jgi:drug/metabolite transporter (DMT)-like permease
LRNSPYLLLVAATFFWGGNFVVGHQVVAHIPPFTLAFLRWVTALLFVLPIYGPGIWTHRGTFLTRWKTVLFLAATGVAAFNTLVYAAVQYTTPINASLMNAATPIIIVLLSTMLLRERLNAIRIVGILISLCGVLWIVTRGSWESLVGLKFNQGDLWMLAAVATWGMYSIGVKKTSGTFPAGELFTVTVVVAVLLLLPLAAIEWLRGIRPHAVTWLDVSGVVYVGTFASIMSFSCWNRAVARIGPSRCASFLNLIPLFSALLAMGFTGQTILLYHGIGAVLIIGGVYLTSRMNHRSTETAS